MNAIKSLLIYDSREKIENIYYNIRSAVKIKFKNIRWKNYYFWKEIK